MNNFESKLVLASFSQSDMKFFFDKMKQLREKTPPRSSVPVEGNWPTGFHAYVGFGTTDNVFIAKDEPSWKILLGWFDQLGLRPGYERARSGGWTNLYTCNLSSLIFNQNGNNKNCKPFGYLILLRPDPPHQTDIQCLLDFFSTHISDRSPFLWETDGYYKWALLVDMISSKRQRERTGKEFSTIFSLLGWLRNKKIQTYTIPLGSQLWTSNNHYHSLFQETPKKALVHMEANVEPGKEVEASKILCQVIRNSQYLSSENINTSDCCQQNAAWLKQVWNSQEPHFSIGSPAPCQLKSFHPSHGTKDVVLSGNFPVFLGSFIKNIWVARTQHDFIKTTRTYLPKDFMWSKDYCEANLECKQCKKCVSSTLFEQIAPQNTQVCPTKDKKNGDAEPMHRNSNNSGVQEEPAKPFNVKDLVCGRDWSDRLDYIRNDIVKKIISTYDKMSSSSLFPFPDIKIQVWGKSGTKKSSIASHNDNFFKNKRLEPTAVYDSDVLLSHADLDLPACVWKVVAWHELILAAFRSMLSYINHYLDITERKVPDIADNEYPPPQFLHSKDDLYGLVWKTLGEPLGTAIGMYIKGYNLPTYHEQVLQAHDDSMSMKSQDYSNRLITAQFILNKLIKGDRDDAPGPHWLNELKDAYNTLASQMPQQCKEWGVEWNNQRIRNIFLGELNPFGFNATAKIRYTMAIQIAWTCAIEFGHQLVKMIKVEPEELGGIDSPKNKQANEDRQDSDVNFQTMLKSPFNAIGFFRSLMIDEDVFLDSLTVYKSGDKIDKSIDTYMGAYLTVEHEFDCLVHSNSTITPHALNQHSETGGASPLSRRKFEVIRRWKGIKDPLYKAWQQLGYDHSMNFGCSERIIETLVKTRNPEQPSTDYQLMGMIPTCALEDFHQATSSGDFLCTGCELIGQFQMSTTTDVEYQILAQSSDKDATIRFPKMLRYFTKCAINKSPLEYSPLSICKRMDLELICLQGALNKLQTTDQSFSKGYFISFNITPWVFDPDFNPWVGEFSDTYVQTASKLCEQIINMGCTPIVEIMEGKLPDDQNAPFWNFLKKLNRVVAEAKNSKSFIGVAIDDQYGDGTDLQRLKMAAENAIAAAQKLQISQLLIKVDFKALLTILGVDQDTKIKDLKNIAPHFKEAFSLIGHLTHHTVHTLEAFKEHGYRKKPALTIVFEGYSGEDGWDEELVTAYKKSIRNAIRGAFKNPGLFSILRLSHKPKLSLNQILVQGRD